MFYILLLVFCFSFSLLCFLLFCHLFRSFLSFRRSAPPVLSIERRLRSSSVSFWLDGRFSSLNFDDISIWCCRFFVIAVRANNSICRLSPSMDCRFKYICLFHEKLDQKCVVMLIQSVCSIVLATAIDCIPLVRVYIDDKITVCYCRFYARLWALSVNNDNNGSFCHVFDKRYHFCAAKRCGNDAVFGAFGLFGKGRRAGHSRSRIRFEFVDSTRCAPNVCLL